MKTTEMIAVMQAYEDGKEIEYYNYASNTWEKTTCPMWDWGTRKYRVKPELNHRPYNDCEEMVADYCERFGVTCHSHEMPIIWLVDSSGNVGQISAFGGNKFICNSQKMLFEEAFRSLEYMDGSTFGKNI